MSCFPLPYGIIDAQCTSATSQVASQIHPRGVNGATLAKGGIRLLTYIHTHNTHNIHTRYTHSIGSRAVAARRCIYIDQTGRTLDHRLKEHRRALISGNVQQSAVAEHATNEMHDIDWEKAEVVDCHPHYRQRCALEAWHIRTEPHKMNRDGGPLPAVYNPLIHHPHRPY